MFQNLPRKAAGWSLILAPLLGLIAVCAWPTLRSSDRAQIAAIAAHPGRWYVFSLFLLLSTYLLVPAVLALMRLLRQSRPTWAFLAGSLALLGVLVGIGDSATELVYWQMGTRGASLSQMTALAGRYESAPGASLIYMIGGVALLCGWCSCRQGYGDPAQYPPGLPPAPPSPPSSTSSDCLPPACRWPSPASR